MDDSCGPTKPKRFLVDVKAGTSSSDAGEITGNVKQVDLPHLTVEKILENLKFKDLLQCSLVNKVWNHEARRLLREKLECALIVDLDEPVVSDFIEMDTTLASAEWPLPFGSLSIRKKSKYPNEQLYTSWTSEERELVESAIKNIILRAGPFRAVQLDVACDLNISVQSWIVRKLLAQVQKTVEVMIIKDSDSRNICENAIGFPELKKLEIYSHVRIFDPDLRTYRDYLEELEIVALMSSKWLKLLENIAQARKLALVKEFTCTGMFHYSLRQRRAAESADLKPKLEKLYIPLIPDDIHARIRPDETRSISVSSLFSSLASFTELQSASIIVPLCPKLEELEVKVQGPFTANSNTNSINVRGGLL